MPFPAARISNQKQNAKGSLPGQGGKLAAVLLGTDSGGLFEGLVEVAVVVIAHPFGNLHDFNVFIHELLGPANPLFNDIADEGGPSHAFKELADIGDAVIILLCHLLEGERLRQMLFHIVKDGAHQADMLALLDCGRRIGLTMTDSYMLTPTKSLTCLLGLTADAGSCHMVKCAACDNVGCAFRRV